MSWNALAVSIHAINVEKGFWPPDRNVGEAIALCHSEVSEAAEYAAPTLVGTDVMDDKLTHLPGVFVELADVAIRVLDLGGHFKADFDAMMYKSSVLPLFGVVRITGFTSLNDDLMIVHNLLSRSLEAHRKGKPIQHFLVYVLIALDRIAEKLDFNLLQIIDQKVAYNKTRPFMHGKKY